MAGTPFTNPDWAEETTEQIDRLVGVVRDRVTNSIITVVRTIVFGLLGATFIVLVLVPTLLAIRSDVGGLLSRARRRVPAEPAP